MLCACAGALAIAAPSALAAPGSLDSGFGTGGKVTLNFGGTDRATHVVITPDGRTVVLGSSDASGGGDFAIDRLKADGSPDPTFNFGVKETLGTQPGANDIGGGVVVLPDERIVIAGQGNTTQDFVTKRLNADGTPDPTFGNAGTAAIDFGGNDIANQMVRQGDGKLVLVGATGAVGHRDFAMARLNADGTPDPSFGVGGKTTIDFGGDDSAYGVGLQTDGKIVIAGQGDPDNEMAIARLNADGSPDATFGTGGEATIDFGGASGANAMALQSDGKIVLAGFTAAVGSGDFALARLNVNGALDPTFHGTGKQTLGYGAPDEAADGVVVQPNGRIAVMGNGDVNHDFAVSRLNSDGSVDPSFGTGGTVGVDFGGYEYDGDLALQPDGKLVLAGSTNLHDGGDMALARLAGDPVPPPGGTTGGAGSNSQPPALSITVTPSVPIATVSTLFTFTVRRDGVRAARAFVSFDGQRHRTSGSGIAHFRGALDLHPYVAGATLTGASPATVQIVPRYVPRLSLLIFPGRPRVGRLTNFVFYVALKGKPIAKAWVTFDGMRRRSARDGSVRFTAGLANHGYVVTATRAGALSTSAEIHPIRFPF